MHHFPIKNSVSRRRLHETYRTYLPLQKRCGIGLRIPTSLAATNKTPSWSSRGSGILPDLQIVHPATVSYWDGQVRRFFPPMTPPSQAWRRRPGFLQVDGTSQTTLIMSLSVYNKRRPVGVCFCSPSSSPVIVLYTHLLAPACRPATHGHLMYLRINAANARCHWHCARLLQHRNRSEGPRVWYT